MNYLILSLLVIVINLSIYSQPQEDSIPCDITVKIDSYSGKKTIATDYIDLKDESLKDIGTYCLSKDKGIVNLYLRLESVTLLTIRKGELIYIKFTDNSVIKFVNPSTNASDYEKGVFSNSFFLNLTGNNLLQMKVKKIKGIKCYINEYNISEYGGENFQAQLNCIIKTK